MKLFFCFLILFFCDKDEVMRAVLPANMEIPSGYEQIGHIAHLNLRDELEPYKFLIGQVILEVRFSFFLVVKFSHNFFLRLPCW